jgi:hypothetical protein
MVFSDIIWLVNEFVVPKFSDGGIMNCISIRVSDEDRYTGDEVLVFTFTRDKFYFGNINILRDELIILYKIIGEYDTYVNNFFWIECKYY